MTRRALLGTALSLAGCAVLPATPYVQKHDWPLVVRRPESLPERQGRPVLLVRTMRAAPGLEARGLQSILADGSIVRDFYEAWAVPPAEAIEDDLRRWLADAGSFAAVLAPGSRLSADLVLESELTALWFDQRIGKVRMALAIVLIAPAAPRARVLLQRSFAAETKPESPGAAAIVAATHRAVAEILGEIEADLALSLRQPGITMPASSPAHQ
ncbi:ABC-type transport auxiliary lipoprotein family protein [Acidiphilium sp.]|uniref:ABC-type transport auxiliary lipoprotein family protein n=1 Tax=Acidiphilium sp. TaxID=527 RepID=UPI00258CF9C3|nr:ABC-type transport auxiliary lipoprotein family protein [Acidiphilium sp.]